MPAPRRATEIPRPRLAGGRAFPHGELPDLGLDETEVSSCRRARRAQARLEADGPAGGAGA